MQRESLAIPIVLRNGEHLFLHLFGVSKNAKMYDSEDAIENGEARYQLVEGAEYEYELMDVAGNPTKYQLDSQEEIVRNSKRQINAGTIKTGIFVGTFSSGICLAGSGEKLGEVALEIQSSKTGYRTDYREMLHDITEFYTDLLMQQGTVVTQSFEIDNDKSSETLYQKYSFVKSLIETETFTNAIHKVIVNPVRRWEQTECHKDITNVKKFTRQTIRQIVTSHSRIPIQALSENHILYSKGIHTIPRIINDTSKKETFNNQENQFVKYVLSSFVSFCQIIYESPYASSLLRKDAAVTLSHLRSLLSNTFFKSISKPSHLNIGSPVLQRKEGYREILQAWLMFDLAAKLSWRGGNDIYKAGKRNVAALYEYWVFFKLLRLVSETFHIPLVSAEHLVSKDKDGINLELRQGQSMALRGHCDIFSRRLNLCMYYNRTFLPTHDISESGSWTRTMRPDYTLSIWTGNDDSPVGEADAEKNDTIVHIHFDAKYRIENIPIVEQIDDASLTEEKNDNELHIYKRGDLLKMHAYKDAIRRTSGAYVIYPGNVNAKKIRGYHEIIPGLGAFCLSPNSIVDDTREIQSFLLEIKNHLMNRASERERIFYHQHRIHTEERNRSELVTPLPEQIGNRKLIPDETYVLMGYYKNDKQLKWILNEKKYNFRAGFRIGTLHMESEIVSAKYLLLRHGNEEAKFFKLVNDGPIIVTRQGLLDKGYPMESDKEEKEKIQNVYLVYDLVEPEREFLQYHWNSAKVKQRNGRQSAHPDWMTLTELMLLHD